MNLSKRLYPSIVLLVCVGFALLIGFRYGSLHSSMQYAPGVENTQTNASTTADFAAFWKVWNVLDNKFSGSSTTTDQEKVYGAIKGLTESLGDPYTVFFAPEESKIFQSEISGSFEGVGMEVGIKDSKLVVVSPIKDTPAMRAGVKAGDFIAKINEQDSLNMPTDKAIKLIRGKAGTVVKLTLLREGVKAPLEISITRAVIEVPTIKTDVKSTSGSASASGDGTGLRKDGIFVISLYSFTANSANLFRQALRDFIDSGSHKLIIDLRGNPGGYLDAAVDMASWFLPSGKTVVKEDFGAGNGDPKVYRSKGYDIFTEKLQLIVLVDGGSASASEILAGALSENGVAKLVGSKTFGKGSVQELVTITPDTSLKVTVAKWLTPLGNSISKLGITPDYVVPMTQADIDAKRDPQMDKAVQLLSQKP